MPKSLRPLFAEFIGAFAIVFMGSAAIMMSARTNSQAALLANSVAYALTIAALVAAFSRISGHFNPAITVAHVVTRRTAPVDGVLKIVAQLVGASVGAWVLASTFPPDVLQATRIGGTILASDITFTHGVILEAVTTALLALTVCGVTSIEARPPAAGIIVGFVVGALIMGVGPLTGASFNPARSFGPALLSGIWEAQLVYWIGPIIGAVGGTVLWDVALKDKG
ncbi:MAG: aquaporin [Gemmatimonadetes bacterium]|nr:aquaporin [Gemmatimonadota bacterium]